MKILLILLIALSVGCANTVRGVFDVVDRTLAVIPAVLESAVLVNAVVKDIKAGQDAVVGMIPGDEVTEEEAEEEATPDAGSDSTGPE